MSKIIKFEEFLKRRKIDNDEDFRAELFEFVEFLFERIKNEEVYGIAIMAIKTDDNVATYFSQGCVCNPFVTLRGLDKLKSRIQEEIDNDN